MEAMAGHFREAIDGDEADEVVETEGAPGLTFKVVVGERGVVRLARFDEGGSVVSGDEEVGKGAFGFTDRAVLLEVGEGNESVGECTSEALEIPST